jgi:hypothetical protein
MSTKRTGDLVVSPRPAKLPRLTRPTFLQIRLPNQYIDILPDLLLLDCRLDHVHKNNSHRSYLYTLAALILDLSREDLHLYCTLDGLDTEDDDPSWTVVEDSQTFSEGGVYLCRPLSGMLFSSQHC